MPRSSQACVAGLQAAMESKQSMALEGGQGTGSKLADLHLDDLLGLTDPIPEESPVQTPTPATPATPSAFDPFKSQQQVAAWPVCGLDCSCSMSSCDPCIGIHLLVF